MNHCPTCKTEMDLSVMPNGHTHYGKLLCPACGWWKWQPKPRQPGDRRPSSLGLGKKFGNGICVICARKHRDNIGLHGHHIVAVKDGGDDTRENILPACKICHQVIHLIRKLVASNG